MAICEIRVTKEQYDNIKKRILEIKDTNQGYNIVGLLLAYFRIKLHRNKYYCSEFVYEVLSSDGVEIIERDDELPKGLYLRNVDGRLWLRGYVCDSAYRFSSNDLFAFEKLSIE